jgi:hypothetical protein
MDDYYSILGVTRSANFSTIRESYRKLALRFHPDKNKDKSATSDFQRIVRAWEVLQDQERRENYDRMLFGYTNRGSEQNYNDNLRSKERNEEDSPDVKNWAKFTAQDLNIGRLIRREKSRAWREVVKADYRSRFDVWNGVRTQLVPLASVEIHSIQLRESHLSNMGNCETIVQFQNAIELSKSAGSVSEDPGVILSRLVCAKEKYIARLSQELLDAKTRYHQILLRLQENQRNFEHREIDAQQMRIQEALQILGPRHIAPPLMIDVDGRLQAINRWESLAKIGSSQNFSKPSLNLSEGPWHSAVQDWDRLAGEHQCSRCNKMDFHVIPECSPARCPGCENVVCNECHRDLWLLQKYEEWVMSPPEDSRNCFFTLEV